eukprot:6207374-Pleurochrysis_carterae.AAC.1
MQRVQYHIIGVAMKQRLSVRPRLHIEMSMRMLHAPLLVAPLARLVGVPQQRSFLGLEALMNGRRSCSIPHVVHERAARRSARPRMCLTRHAIVPQREPLLDAEGDAARVEEAAQLVRAGRRLQHRAKRLARASAEATPGQVLAMAEARQVTHHNRRNANMYNRPRVVEECNGVGSAEPQQLVQVVAVVALQEPLRALLVVVHHTQSKNPEILRRLRREWVVQHDGCDFELAKPGSIPRHNDGHGYFGVDEMGKWGHAALLARVVGQKLAQDSFQR